MTVASPGLMKLMRGAALVCRGSMMPHLFILKYP